MVPQVFLIRIRRQPDAIAFMYFVVPPVILQRAYNISFHENIVWAGIKVNGKKKLSTLMKKFVVNK